MNAQSITDSVAIDLARRLRCDHSLVLEILRRLESGELSPAEATSQLLAQPPASTPRTEPGAETLDSLISRLGPPPNDIIDEWCHQLRIAAIDRFSRTSEPLPPTLNLQLAVDKAGRLIVDGQPVPTSVDQQRTDVDPISTQRIDQFRQSLSSSANINHVLDSTLATIERETRAEPSRRLPKPSEPQQSSLTPWLARGLIVAAIAGGAWLLASATQRDRRDDVAVVQTENPPAAPVVETIETPNSELLRGSTNSQAQLETFDGRAELDSNLTEDIETSTPDLLVLDDLIPAVGDGGGAASDELESSVASSDPAKRTEASGVSGESIDPLGDEDSPPPAESPQATRTSQARSVQLPPSDQPGTSTPLKLTSGQSIRLDFPFEIPLVRSDADSGFQIIDSDSEFAVARVFDGESGWQHQWTEAASKISSAKLLLHGRIRTDAGGIVFLRPLIESDPWPIRLDRADVQPSWDLLGPMPPRVSRLSIDFALPEGIEVGWIEPVDETATRRSRALAVLNSADSEFVSLGVRLDIRGGRKLSCRVRYAAKLDPTGSWQAVSRPSLDQLANQVTARTELLSQQKTQLTEIYNNADSGLRSELRPQRDAIDGRIKSMQLLSGRVADLQSLVSKIESDGRLVLRVWVQWPDGQQSLLETTD